MVSTSIREATMAEPATLGHWLRDRESFLEFLGLQAERWEFFSFFVKAMVGGTIRHNTIAMNITRLLHGAVAGGPCRVLQDGIRLEPEHNEDVTFPDVMVICEPVSETAVAVSRPSVIVEVLSRSTEWESRGPKWAGYQGIPTLRHYVLVSRSAPAVEAYSRAGADEDWTFRAVRGLDAMLELAAVGARLPLAEVYRGTDIGPR